MGYLHIKNLYKDQRIQEFRRVYCLEKIHGTSAHISWNIGELGFFSGGEKYERFVSLFDKEALTAAFLARFGEEGEVIVYGEAYGGRQQGMKATYGEQLRFVAFDVRVEDLWLDVPTANLVVEELGLEFVHWVHIGSDLEKLTAQRDAPSVQAHRNGIEGNKMREGIVIRPPFEVRLNNDERLIAKYKNDAFKETKTPRVVSDEEAKVLSDAQQIAEEWVTVMRLDHVLDKLPEAKGMEHTSLVLKAMVEDVLREAEGEIVVTKAARKAISNRAATLWKKRVTALS